MNLLKRYFCVALLTVCTIGIVQAENNEDDWVDIKEFRSGKMKPKFACNATVKITDTDEPILSSIIIFK